jgi:hypothetical protein
MGSVPSYFMMKEVIYLANLSYKALIPMTVLRLVCFSSKPLTAKFNVVSSLDSLRALLVSCDTAKCFIRGSGFSGSEVSSVVEICRSFSIFMRSSGDGVWFLRVGLPRQGLGTLN